MDADSPTSLVRHTMDRPAQLARQVHDISEHIVSLRLPVAKSDPSSQEVYFTPRHKLAKEITREMIKKLLEYHGVRDTNCDTVHDDYLAVFCILIRIGKPKDIALGGCHSVLVVTRTSKLRSGNSVRRHSTLVDLKTCNFAQTRSFP
jgi:hypothetical protein